jgi:hypothetical protein
VLRTNAGFETTMIFPSTSEILFVCQWIKGIKNWKRVIDVQNKKYVPKKFLLFLTSFGNISIEVNENVYFGNSRSWAFDFAMQVLLFNVTIYGCCTTLYIGLALLTMNFEMNIIMFSFS